LAQLILSAINGRNRELTATIERTLDADTRALLDALLIQQTAADGAAPGRTRAYKLTLLKKLSQSTKPSKVKERVGDSLLIEGLYQRLQPVLAVLALNPEGIRYYANSVIKVEIFQVARRDDEDRYLHLIAFIAHQYYRLQDNLVDVLLTSLASYQNSAQREHKEQCYARRAQRNQSIKALVGYLDEDLLKVLAAIRTITDEPYLSAAEKVDRIRALLATQDANQHHAKLDLTRLKRELETELSEDDYHRILEAKSIRIQNRISPIIKTLTFQGEPNAREVLAAIQYFKDKDGLIDKAAPLGFLAADEHTAVIEGGKFRVSLYKALLFLHIQSAIKSGTLNLKQSYKYRPLDDYLIAREHWCRDKDVLLERAGLQAAASPQPVLAELDEQLYAQYVTTNHNLLEGRNPFIKFGQKGVFSLTTPKAEESDTEPLQHFFSRAALRAAFGSARHRRSL
jgi:hypothetical protein